MKKTILLSCIAWFCFMGVVSQVPATSSEGNETWYYIKAQRGLTTSALWATAKQNNSQVLNEDLALSDAQLWKVVENGDGLALVNKAFNTYLNTDSANYKRLTTTATPPAKTLKISSSPYSTDGVLIENTGVLSFRLHAGGENNIFGWINFIDDAEDNCSFFFVTEVAASKMALAEKLNAAKQLEAASLEGYAPGQYLPQSMASFKTAINAAQGIYDNATSTYAENKNAITTLQASIDDFKAGVILIAVSTPDNEKWFFLKSQRGASAAEVWATAQADNSSVLNKPLNLSDAQRWKVVVHGNGYALVNKAYNTYLNTEPANHEQLTTKTTAPLQDLVFKSSNYLPNAVIAENSGSTLSFRLHAGGENNNWTLLNFLDDIQDNCSFIFVPDQNGPKSALEGSIILASDLLNSSKTGDQPGQYSQETKATLQTAIIQAQAIYDANESSSTDYISGITALETSMNTFRASVIRPITVSTPGKEYWYYIQFKKGGNVISDQGPGINLKTAILANGSPAQLWKFEEVAPGSASYYVTSLLGYKLAWGGAKYTTFATAGIPMSIDTTHADESYRPSFELRRTDGTAHLNQWGGAGIGKELGEYSWGDTNNPLVFVAATPEELTKAADSLTIKLKDILLRVKNKASDTHATSVEGIDPGQYTSQSKSSLLELINNAQTVLENTTATPDQVGNTINNVNSGLSVFLNSVNKPFFISTPGVMEYYYAIYPPNRLMRTLTNSGGNILTSRVHNNESEISDTISSFQKWIFVQLPDGTFAIVNPKTVNPTIASDVYIGTANTDINSALKLTTSPITVNGWQIQAAEGASLYLLIQDNAKLQINEPNWAGNEVINWGYAASYSGSSSNAAGYITNDAGSSYKFALVGTKDFSFGTKQTNTTQHIIRISNQRITVDGSQNFELYSATGLRLNPKSVLNKGVYIIKINRETQKVVIQ